MQRSVKEGGLEARLSEAHLPRVVILDDEKSWLGTLEQVWEQRVKPGQETSYDVSFTTDPDEAYRLAIRKDCLVAVLDLMIGNKSRFTDGLDLAAAIKKKRRQSIDVGAMTGHTLVSSIISSANMPYIDFQWVKKERVKELFEMITSAVEQRKRKHPPYANLYIFAGPSGSGKTTIGGNLDMVMNFLNVEEAASGRPPRPSDIASQERNLYRRHEHRYVPPERWATEMAGIGESYHWVSLNNPYALDILPIRQNQAAGEDTVVLIRPADAVRGLLEPVRFPNARIIYLISSREDTENRMRWDKRTEEEIKARLSLVTPAALEEYKELACRYGAAIKNPFIDYSAVPGESLKDSVERSVDNTRLRVIRFIEYARKHPPGLPAADLHAAFVADAERAISGGTMLEKGGTIEIPYKSLEDFRRNYNLQPEAHNVLMRLSKLSVTSVTSRNGVKEVSLVPLDSLNTRRDVLGIDRNVLFWVLAHSMANQGFFHAAEPDSVLQPSMTIPTARKSSSSVYNLDYSLTDLAPIRADGSSGNYGLRLIVE